MEEVGVVTARDDLRREGVPIYIQLAGLFRRRIESGEWRVGNHIPTLDALAIEFGVARATIRQATGLLRQEGIIERYRGRGTIVIHRPQQEFWYEIGADWDSIVAAYRHSGFVSRVLSVSPELTPPPEYEDEMKSSPYHYLRRLNCIGSAPVSVDGAWLQQSVFEHLNEAAVLETPTLILLHEMPGIDIDRAMQSLTVSTADIELSALLNIPLNAPVVVTQRTLYSAADELLCLYQSFNRGDTFRLKTRLR